MPRASCIKNSAWSKSNQKDMLKIQIKIKTKKNILKVYEVVYEDFGKDTCLHPVILLKLDSIKGFFLEISRRVTNSNSAEQLCTAGYLNNGYLWSFRIILLHKVWLVQPWNSKKHQPKENLRFKNFIYLTQYQSTCNAGLLLFQIQNLGEVSGDVVFYQNNTI